MPASFKLGQAKKRAGMINRQTDHTNSNTQDEEHLPETRQALLNVGHASGDNLHRTVMSLQRTIGNRATGTLVRQKAAPTVQRVIAEGGDKKPVLITLFDDAERVVRELMQNNTYARFKDKLPANSPMKEQDFATAWGVVANRAAIQQFAAGEFNSENVNFLLAVEAYKPAHTMANAMEIMDTYIKAGSPQEINIDADMRNAYKAATAKLNAAAPAPAATVVADDFDVDAIPQGRTRS